MALQFPDAQPNFLAIALQAHEKGRADRQSTLKQNALAGVGTNPDQAQRDLMSIGELDDANTVGQYAGQQRQKQALQSFDPSNPQASLDAARQTGDPETYDMISKLDANQRAKAKESATTLASIGNQMLEMPEEEWPAVYRHLAPNLQQLGITPQQLANAPRTKQAMQAFVASTMSVADQIERADKAGAPNWKERTLTDGSTEWFDLKAEAGGAGAPQGPAPAPGGDWTAGVAAAAPDAAVTSGYRSPADNARVGGVPNSRHMTGEAVDLVPRPGETMAQLHARVRKAPGVRAINEGDHVHVQRDGGAPAPRPGAIRGSAPKPVDPLRELQAQNLQGQITERGQKITAEADKRARGQDAAAVKAQSIIAAVDSATSLIGPGEAGLIGAKMAEVPGTKAYDVARQIDTIKANLGFQELQAMREASPTGGALGAIAVQELVALQATVASLDIGQSEAQLKASLNKIKQHYQRWQGAVGGGEKPSPQTPAKPTAAATGQPPASALKDGHITTFANGQRWTLRGGKPARVQ